MESPLIGFRLNLGTSFASAAHTRDELGISDLTTAKPVQAALASAGTFSIGAAMPLVTQKVTPCRALIPFVAISILLLVLFCGFGTGGAPVMKSALQVMFCSRIFRPFRNLWRFDWLSTAAEELSGHR